MNCGNVNYDDIKKCFDCSRLITVKGVYDVDTKREAFLVNCEKNAYILIEADRSNYRKVL